jgi:hypothetical protein
MTEHRLADGMFVTLLEKIVSCQPQTETYAKVKKAAMKTNVMMSKGFLSIL